MMSSADGPWSREITVVAPINIALVKYWGKRDPKLIIPLNDSVSVTLNGLFAKSVIKVCSKNFKGGMRIFQISFLKCSRVGILKNKSDCAKFFEEKCVLL